MNRLALVLVPFSVLMVSSASLAQKRKIPTQDQIDRCMDERRKELATQKDSLKTDDGKELPFRGGGEYETIAFFECRGVKIDSAFLSQGAFDTSHAFEQLREYRKFHWTEDSDIYEIRINDETYSWPTELNFVPKKGFVLILGTEPPGSLVSISEEIPYSRRSHDVNKMLKDFIKHGFPLDVLIYEYLDDFKTSNVKECVELYRAKCFSFQKGKIKKFQDFNPALVFRFLEDPHEVATCNIVYGDTCTLNLGYSLTDLSALIPILSSESTLLEDWKDKLAIEDGAHIYPNHIKNLAKALGATRYELGSRKITVRIEDGTVEQLTHIRIKEVTDESTHFEIIVGNEDEPSDWVRLFFREQESFFKNLRERVTIVDQPAIYEGHVETLSNAFRYLEEEYPHASISLSIAPNTLHTYAKVNDQEGGKAEITFFVGITSMKEEGISAAQALRSFADPSFLEVLKFFEAKGVPIPSEYTYPTRHNLAVIQEWWTSRLAVNSVKLHDGPNDIKKHWLYDHNTILLNEAHIFNGYTELIQEHFIK